MIGGYQVLFLIPSPIFTTTSKKQILFPSIPIPTIHIPVLKFLSVWWRCLWVMSRWFQFLQDLQMTTPWGSYLPPKTEHGPNLKITNPYPVGSKVRFDPGVKRNGGENDSNVGISRENWGHTHTHMFMYIHDHIQVCMYIVTNVTYVEWIHYYLIN